MEPRSGSGSIVVAQVYYPYYLPPAVAYFPHGGLNDEQTLQTNVAPYFSNGATKNNTQSWKPLQVFQHQYRRRCLSQRTSLRESRWDGCQESEWSHPNFTKRKKNMHTTRKDKSVKVFSDKMFVLKYDYLWKGERCLSSMQQCLKKCIKILQTWIFLKEALRLCLFNTWWKDCCVKVSKRCKALGFCLHWVVASQSHTSLDNCALRRKKTLDIVIILWLLQLWHWHIGSGFALFSMTLPNSSKKCSNNTSLCFKLNLHFY